METIIKAKALVLGDNIDTDQIYPGKYLELVVPSEVGSHCLEGVRSDIAANFPKGGIVIAGRNFGCGSSREHAPIALLNMGASLVIADSFARIFFRNGINLGLPLVVCKGLSKKIADNSEIEVDIIKGTVTLCSTGEVFEAEAMSEKSMEILSAGGIKQLMLKTTGKGPNTKMLKATSR